VHISRRALSSPVIPAPAWPGDRVHGLAADRRIACDGADLQDAKVGVLATPILASVSGWSAFRLIGHVPRPMRARQIAATMEDLADRSDDASIPHAATSAAGATHP
jgi:hypothetical protein